MTILGALDSLNATALNLDRKKMAEMWERPENQDIDDALRSYLLHLNTLLEKSGIGQQAQGSILYRGSDNCDIDFCKEATCDYCDAYGDNYVMIPSNSVLQKQMDHLIDGIEICSLSRGKVLKRVRGGFFEYLKYLSGSVYGNIYLFIRLKYSAAESKIGICQSDEWDEFLIIPTLANYIVLQFLSDVPIPDMPNKAPRYVEDQLLLAAGNAFVTKLLEDYVVGNKNFVGDLNIVSSLAYESQANAGNLVLLHKSFRVGSHNDEFLNSIFEKNTTDPQRTIHLNICFAERVSMTNHKRVRKLFEIATGDTYLVSDGAYIYGITTKASLQVQTVDKYILINICGPLKWELYECQSVQHKELIPHVIYDSTCFKVKKKPAYKDVIANKLNTIIERLSSGVASSKIEPCAGCEHCAECEIVSVRGSSNCDTTAKKMADIVKVAVKQKHGTTIVFSIFAKEEAERLNRTSFRIAEIPLNSNRGIIKQITAIDGAVMCDFDGICYAIGVILDGMAVGIQEKKARKGNAYSQEPEDISRGARYNSAIRYKNANPCSIICIVSEDGDVNII